MDKSIMHGFCRWIGFMLVVTWLFGGSAVAAEFRLTNGDVYRGETAAVDDYGLVIRRDIGSFTPRISWGQLTQETLIEMKKNPQAAKFVEPFIELPPQPKTPEKKKKEIVLKEVTRLERPEKTGLFASLSTPAGIALLAILFLANVYAAYEIAHYRQRPAFLVCGVSVLLPVVGPILFMSLPGAEAGMEMMPDTATAGANPEVLVTNPLAPGKKTGPAPTALGLAAADKKSKPVTTSLEGAVFRRGETTFNRRFFESKLAGFFPVIAMGPEKDLVMVIRAGKNEYVAKRISRISMTDMHVQVLRGATEAQITFAEISEVLVRRRDAKA